jgi:hypothetical protein
MIRANRGKPGSIRELAAGWRTRCKFLILLAIR